MRSALFLILTLFITSSVFAAPTKIQRQADQVTLHVDGDFTPLPSADFLLVIDNSGSMTNYANQLQFHIAALTNSLKISGLDFHIGIITSDTSPFHSGRLLGAPSVVQSTDPNWQEQLRNNSQIGAFGSAYEDFFGNTLAALSPPLIDNENKGFLRNNANLNIIFFTDADDQSKIIPLDFAYKLHSQIVPLNRLSLNGFLADDSYPNCEKDSFGAEEDKIDRALQIINSGKAYSLCSTSPQEQMDDLFSHLPYGNNRHLPQADLSDVELIGDVDVATIQVKYGRQVIPNDFKKGWRFFNNPPALYFSKNITWEPQSGAPTIDITYKLLPTTN